MKRFKTVDVPDELTRAMHRYKGATAAFRKLTPGMLRPPSATTRGNGVSRRSCP